MLSLHDIMLAGQPYSTILGIPMGGNEMESRTAGNELSVGADILHPKIIRVDNSKECRTSLFLVPLNTRDTR
jgi:hypothetical protein